jgi:hypothetical protein
MQQPAGKEHMLRYPKGFIAVRIIQLVIGIVALGLAAYGLQYIIFGGNVMMLISAIVTMITTVYCIVGTTVGPKAYNYWAILAFDIFLVIFWLISFALTAYWVGPVFQEVAYYADYYNTYSDYYSYYGYTYNSFAATVAAVLAAATAMSGAEFLLYIVSLVIHSLALHRHRKAGFHSKPGFSGHPAEVPGAPVPGAPVGGEKFQMQPQPYQQNPQQYPPGFAPQPNFQGPPPTQPGYQGPPPTQPGFQGSPPTQPSYQESPPTHQSFQGPPPPQPVYQQPSQFQEQPTYAPQQHQQEFHPQQQSASPASPVLSQTTGNSYVQGPAVPLTSNSPVYETHGQSANPNQPQQLP